jgi:hypothetical protein
LNRARTAKHVPEAVRSELACTAHIRGRAGQAVNKGTETGSHRGQLYSTLHNRDSYSSVVLCRTRYSGSGARAASRKPAPQNTGLIIRPPQVPPAPPAIHIIPRRPPGPQGPSRTTCTPSAFTYVKGWSRNTCRQQQNTPQQQPRTVDATQQGKRMGNHPPPPRNNTTPPTLTLIFSLKDLYARTGCVRRR